MTTAVPGPPLAPDPRLASAAAMVFVDDPTHPQVDPADLRHLLDVRRLRPGEAVVASDGCGQWVPCRLSDMSGDRSAGKESRHPGVALVPSGPPEHQERPTPSVTVAFAPVKGDRPEWVTQKLTELGVDRIIVLRTARSVVRWEGDRDQRATDRLRRVAREAAAQCRRPWLPEVLGTVGLDEIGALVGGPIALARLGGDRPSLGHPAVAVGPEGGWEEAEIERFEASVGLGPTVLRAETAALATGAALCGLRAGLVGPLA